MYFLQSLFLRTIIFYSTILDSISVSIKQFFDWQLHIQNLIGVMLRPSDMHHTLLDVCVSTSWARSHPIVMCVIALHSCACIWITYVAIFLCDLKALLSCSVVNRQAEKCQKIVLAQHEALYCHINCNTTRAAGDIKYDHSILNVFLCLLFTLCPKQDFRSSLCL